MTARLLAGAGGSWGPLAAHGGGAGDPFGAITGHRAPPALSQPLQCPCPVRRARLRGVGPSRAGEGGARTPRGPSPERLHLPHVSPRGLESPHLLHKFRYTWIPSNRAATDGDKQSPEASSRGLSPARGGSARDRQRQLGPVTPTQRTGVPSPPLREKGHLPRRLDARGSLTGRPPAQWPRTSRFHPESPGS